MAQVKVQLDVMNAEIITKQVAKHMGLKTVRMAKDMISKGMSPVRGYGRFPAYAAQRASGSVKKARGKFKSKRARDAATRLIKERESGKYPWSVMDRFPDKKVRPVNLFLNGWYLDHYTYWFERRRTSRFSRSKNYSVIIGLSSSRDVYSAPPPDVFKYFEAHNEGMHKDVPMRRHLPTRQGEEFAVSIMREIVRIVGERVKVLARDQNNRTRKNK